MSSRCIPCDYCGGIAELVTGRAVYPLRSDLWNKMFYRCAPCDAWVGCHPGTVRPLGRLANAELRRWKGLAHAIFDPLWRRKMQKEKCRKADARGKAYQWLAAQMEIEPELCHIGMFDVEKCRQVVRICEPYSRKRLSVQ